MIDTAKPLFERFGRLDTWIVGIQYYDGAKRMASEQVYFDRERRLPRRGTCTLADA